MGPRIPRIMDGVQRSGKDKKKNLGLRERKQENIDMML